MIKRICFIAHNGPFNRYHSRSYFIKQLAEAMNRVGIETKVIEKEETAEEMEVASQVTAFGPDLICSFNRLSSIPEKKFIADELQLPYLSILTDSPLYSTGLASSRYSIIACTDLNDYQMIKSIPFNNALFFPMAVEKGLSPSNGEKSYDLVFLGSCYDYENFRRYWRVRHPWEINNALDHAIDLILSDKNISIANALVTAWEEAQLTKDANFYTHFYFLDVYTRGKERVDLIKSIKDVPVHVFGDIMADHVVNQYGWSHYLGTQSNVTLHKAVSYAESLNILQNSKLSLISNPSQKNGMNERFPYAISCGSLPISNENDYLKEKFPESYVSYCFDKRDDINHAIKDLLENESSRQQKVSTAYNAILKEHTWDHRVAHLLKELPPMLEKMAKKNPFF